MVAEHIEYKPVKKTEEAAEKQTVEVKTEEAVAEKVPVEEEAVF